MAESRQLGIRPSLTVLKDNPIEKIARYARERTDVIPMWFGESDKKTPDFICDAAMTALHQGRVLYPGTCGMPEFRKALAAYHNRIYDLPLPAERFFAMSSGMVAIMMSFQMLCEPGDEVVAPAPIWPNIPGAATLCGARVRTVPMHLDETGWHLNVQQLFDATTEKTRAIFINSPCNPNGWMMSHREMHHVLDFAREKGLWIISDEVYGRQTFDTPRAPSFLDITDPDDRLIVINSFSKSWSMTGWRLGWMVAPEYMTEPIQKTVQFNNMGTSEFLQCAGIAALERGEDFLADEGRRHKISRDIICSALREIPQVTFTDPPSTFYVFFRVLGCEDSVALAKRLIDEVGVGLAPGAAFGEAGEGCLRLCCAVDPSKAEVAADLLVRALR
ncbi:MAG: pyridoxal phosphate-dependent aminotransferase [Pseudomonadota bacterium]|nr:pyridoxal phosphate-dependent aminotransferase [Pseudomonadota bacterium]